MNWYESDAFKEYLPWLRAIPAKDVRAGKHARLELASNTPGAVKWDAIQLYEACVSCGRHVYVFRTRASARGRNNASGIYLAVTCPLDVSVGCSRGRKAAEAYDAIERLIREHQAGQPQQGELV